MKDEARATSNYRDSNLERPERSPFGIDFSWLLDRTLWLQLSITRGQTQKFKVVKFDKPEKNPSERFNNWLSERSLQVKENKEQNKPDKKLQ